MQGDEATGPISAPFLLERSLDERPVIARTASSCRVGEPAVAATPDPGDPDDLFECPCALANCSEHVLLGDLFAVAERPRGLLLFESDAGFDILPLENLDSGFGEIDHLTTGVLTDEELLPSHWPALFLNVIADSCPIDLY